MPALGTMGFALAGRATPAKGDLHRQIVHTIEVEDSEILEGAAGAARNVVRADGIRAFFSRDARERSRGAWEARGTPCRIAAIGEEWIGRSRSVFFSPCHHRV